MSKSKSTTSKAKKPARKRKATKVVEVTEPAPITVEAATAAMQRDYYHEIRSLADAAIRAYREYKAEGSRLDMSDVLHEQIDGHHDVIYTWQAQRVLWLSDNSEAYQDADVALDGSQGDIWSTMAYFAMRADVEAIVNARADEWEGQGDE